MRPMADEPDSQAGYVAIHAGGVMAIDSQRVAMNKNSLLSSKPIALVRLVLAFVVTGAFLPYAWGRTFVIWMQVGKPELSYAAILGIGIAGLVLLNWGLAAAFSRARDLWLVGSTAAVVWLAVNGTLLVLYVEADIPKAYIGGLYALASLWVGWLGWMFFAPMRWTIRLGVLVLCLLAIVPFPLLFTAGLTGDSHVSLEWRQGNDGGAQTESPAISSMSAVSATIDVKHTGEHDFAQFLGPQRSGVIADVHLARNWETNPPRLIWRRPVGAGWGAFAFAGDLAITQEQQGGEECVVCRRVSNGAELWRHADAINFDSSMGGPGPRATPTIAGGRVYAVGATGILNCLNGATGEIVWSVDILKDNSAENIAHGVAGSPLLVDNLVVVCPTGSNGLCLAAYDKDSGKRVWQGGKDQTSYASPMLAELHGARQILLFTSKGLTGHDAGSGAVLWSFPFANDQFVNCSQPIVNVGATGQIFVSTGYSKGCALIQVDKTTDGSWQAHALWTSRNMKTKFTSAVLYQKFIYGLDDGMISCIDPAREGKLMWKERRYRHGQVLLVDDLLLIQAEDGSVALVEPSPQGLRELGQFRALAHKTWNNPALAGRLLLVRNDREAACYELALAGTGGS